MTRKNLILLYRAPEYEKDFAEIAQKVHAIDPDITVFYLFAGLDAQLPAPEWQHPTLTVALCRKFRLPIERGPVLKNFAILKLEQQDVLRANGLPTPMALQFSFGMQLDPILFGEHVLLKPLDPHLGSHGAGVHVIRRQRLQSLTASDFPDDHPIRWSEMGYIVQRFINTGTYPSTYRVTTFMGEVLFAARYVSTIASPDLDAPDHEIETGEFTQKIGRTITFEIDEPLLAIARDVANAFAHVPLLGIDFVKEAHTGQPYILEVNAGGNTWHFSSEMWAERRREHPELLVQMKKQFGAFDVAAQALVNAVHAQAR